MNSWLTYPEFTARYPGAALTEADFTPLAADAALFILGATRWCAGLLTPKNRSTSSGSVRPGWCIWRPGWTPPGTA